MTAAKHFSKFPKTKWRWKNFSPRELACKGTGFLLVNENALDKLQALRNELDRPLLITSAYRSPQHNKNVGGATNSLHMQGIAFDVRMENQDPHEFEAAARRIGFTGFGYYPHRGFMHIDTRTRPTTWGTPFPRTITSLPPEPVEISSPVQSTTVQASAVQIASGMGGGVTAFANLDGVAQIVALIVSGVVILAALWIMRERIKKMIRGD